MEQDINYEYADRILDVFDKMVMDELNRCDREISNPDMKNVVKKDSKIKNEFLTKIGYTFRRLPSLFSTKVLHKEQVVMSYDEYKHYCNVEDKDKNNKSNIKNAIKYYDKIKEKSKTYAKIAELLKKVREYVMNGGALSFMEFFSLNINEYNKYWSLFNACSVMGINVGSFKNNIKNDNERDLDNPYFKELENIVLEYDASRGRER